MENLKTATVLALMAQKHIVLQTLQYESCKNNLVSVLTQSLDIHDIVEVDLLQDHTFEQLVDRMVLRQHGHQPRLYQVVVWKNLESVPMSLSTRFAITTIFDQLERYNTLASRYTDPATPIKLGPYMIEAPTEFLIMPILETPGSFPKLSQLVKDRFWFCQSFSEGADRVPAPMRRAERLQAREALCSVYASPEIQEYVCSLLVFTRSHRLCSLAPVTTRPSLRALTGVMLLAKALVVYAERASSGALFVTPEYVKLAFRKVAYWLVDWESNVLYSRPDQTLEFQRRSEIAMLTGDWYGSEWEGVRRYLDSHASMGDPNSTTGFTNRLVEEVLETVAPPL